MPGESGLNDSPKRRLRRTQAERSEATRSQLIDATISVLLEKGYRRCTVTEICRSAGVTTGALQHHYGSKSALLTSVIKELFPPFQPLLPEEISVAGSFRRRCDAVVDAYWRIYSDPRYPAVWEIIIGSRSDPDAHALVRKFQRQTTEAGDRMIGSLFADSGLSRRELAELHQFTTSELRGIGLLAVFGEDVTRRTRQIEQAKDTLHRILRQSMKRRREAG